jgi:hypothetical protein
MVWGTCERGWHFGVDLYLVSIIRSFSLSFRILTTNMLCLVLGEVWSSLDITSPILFETLRQHIGITATWDFWQSRLGVVPERARSGVWLSLYGVAGD